MIEPTDIIYAQKLRGLRLGRNLKQTVLCTKIGISSQQEYSKLENGKMHFTDEILEKISQAFEMTVEEFMMPQGNANISNSPNANNNSPHGSVNHISLIETVLKSKDETIIMQKQHIQLLEKILKEKGYYS